MSSFAKKSKECHPQVARVLLHVSEVIGELARGFKVVLEASGSDPGGSYLSPLFYSGPTEMPGEREFLWAHTAPYPPIYSSRGHMEHPVL